eukprot:359787-Chlamydomonas_euryale.AAC.2
MCNSGLKILRQRLDPAQQHAALPPPPSPGHPTHPQPHTLTHPAMPCTGCSEYSSTSPSLVPTANE